ncbi:MAG: hypothetical protein E7240_03680 [Lachnospiraceae bacterium]|nr:hypothetical protein [Lachnospiraceae bacterium]
MEGILLAVMILAVFVFGFFIVSRFGRFLDKNFIRYQEPEESERKVFTAETGGKSSGDISDADSIMLDPLQDCGNYERIISEMDDLSAIEFPENPDYEIK